MVEAALGGGVALAAGAGVATFFSPCTYALLPSYVGFYVASVEQEEAPVGGALLRGAAAAVGVVTSFAVLSVAAFEVADALERHLDLVENAVGVLLVFLGLLTLTGSRLGWSVTLPRRRASVAGFLGFGAVYAAAAAGCVAPVFLGVVLQATTYGGSGAAVVLGTYASTFAVLMLGATVATAVGHGIGFERVEGYRELAVKAAGALLVVGGVVQILYVAPS